jgi:RsiW-degrading membrane proteinase PrsW (M82 family)
MPTEILREAPVALAPVAIFLIVLLSFDSYKLVSVRETAFTLIAGALACVAAYYANGWLIGVAGMDFEAFSRTLGPLVEESFKASIIVWLLLRNRIGFMIDAAIMGFAVGTGFAVVENLYYLSLFPDASFGVWIVRGFGTAFMHGGGTALFAILSQSLVERALRRIPPPEAGGGLATINPLVFLPGFTLAIALRLLGSIAIHVIYNFFSGAPLLGAITVLILLPVSLVFVVTKSEHRVHSWLLHDYETHEKLLADIQSGAFRNSEAGRFVATMATKFGPDISADMFAYIRVHTELALRADQVDLAREKGGIPITDNDREKFRRLHELEKRIGRTAMLALWPHLHFTRKQLWELNEFEQEVREA